jgi:hypothetical protein
MRNLYGASVKMTVAPNLVRMRLHVMPTTGVRSSKASLFPSFPAARPNYARTFSSGVFILPVRQM